MVFGAKFSHLFIESEEFCRKLLTLAQRKYEVGQGKHREIENEI